MSHSKPLQNTQSSTPSFEPSPAPVRATPLKAAKPKTGGSPVHAHFVTRMITNLSGVDSLRKICTHCHPLASPNLNTSKEDLSIAVKLKQDELKAKGMRGKPAGTYDGNIESTTPILKHMQQFHDDLEVVVPPPASSRHGPRIDGLTEDEEKFLWWFADCKEAPRMVRKASFKACHPNFPWSSDSTVAKKVAVLRDATEKEVRKRIAGQMVFMMLDGGTILTKNLLNVCVGVTNEDGSGCDIYFHKSVNCKNSESATLTPIVAELVADLATLNATVIAVVSDNASNMSAMVDRLNGRAAPSDDENSGDEENGADNENDDDETDVEADEDADEEADDFGFDDLVDVGLEFDLPDGFIFHIRCWGHTFQLVFRDLARDSPLIKKAFATAARIIKAFQSRELRFLLKKECIRSGETVSTLKQPADTRWNSHVRTVVRVHRLSSQMNAVFASYEKKKVRPISPTEFTALQQAIVVLQPIAWATDAVQADTCTALSAVGVMERTLKHIEDAIEEIETAFNDPANQAPQILPLLASLRAAKTSIGKRGVMFNNGLVEVMRFLHPVTGIRSNGSVAPDHFESQYQWLVAHITSILRSTGRSDFIKAAIAELQSFCTRPVVSPEDGEVWWTGTAYGRYPNLTQLFKQLAGFVFTEASVERSFGLQSSFWTKERNGMKCVTAETWVYIAWNYPRIFRKPILKVPTSRREDLTCAVWRSFIGSCLSGAAMHAAKSSQAKSAAPSKREREMRELAAGDILVVKFVEYDDKGKEKTKTHKCIVRRRHNDKEDKMRRAREGVEVWDVVWIETGEMGLLFPYAGDPWIKDGAADEWEWDVDD